MMESEDGEDIHFDANDEQEEQIVENNDETLKTNENSKPKKFPNQTTDNENIEKYKIKNKIPAIYFSFVAISLNFYVFFLKK